jgi:uncharacterized protein (DUF58 family)
VPVPAGNHNETMNKHTARHPIAVGRHRIRIRPTRSGIIFLILVLAMFMGSLNYNNNLGFLLTFLLGSIALVSIADTYKSIAGISIGSSYARPVFAGENAVFELIASASATNRGRIGFAFDSQPIGYHELIAHEDSRIQVTARTTARGILRPGPLSIHSTYPLGLWRIGTRIDLNLEAVVYPQPRRGNVEVLEARSPVGEDTSDGGSGSDDFQGLKNYAPGDPLQRISWRASSRGQGIFTKDFNGLYAAAPFLDWHTLKASDPEHKLSRLCHMVLTAYQNEWTYGLRLPDQSIGPGNGYGHRNRCLKALALFR